MRILFRTLLIVFLICSSTGCAHYFGELASLSASNIQDLEAARASGYNKIVSLNYETALNEIIKILQKNELTIFQISKKRRYIVAMGFTKQVSTTRIGIFFEPLENNKTKITLSSLSPAVLAKAEDIIFGAL